MFKHLSEMMGAALYALFMPDWTAASVQPKKNFTLNILCSGGDMASVTLNGIDATATDAELNTLRTRIMAASNGVPISQHNSYVQEIAKGVDQPYDESYSDASTKLVLTYQSETLEVARISIPAPDETFFGPYGVSAITPDPGAAVGTPGQVLSVINSSVINLLELDGAGAWHYTGGYRSNRSRSLPRPRTVVLPVEPATGVPPGDAPGVPE